MLCSIVFRRAFVRISGRVVPMNTQGVPSVKRYYTEPFVRKDGDYYAKLDVEDKRKEYKCGSRYKTLEHITPWSEWRLRQKFRCESGPLSDVNQVLNEKVSVWQGDITQLEIDAIVNAANRSLLGGGGVDGAIHSAAGWSLRHECENLNGCQPGDAKLTSGHRLPAKYILHTVGPMNEDRDVLKSCYEKCLQLVDEHNIKSVAFCCIATGIYGFPNENAAHIALETIRSWLETEDHHEKIDRIIFCVFLDVDYKIYQRLMQVYFPRDEDVPSVEMLQKRLDSLREIPVTSEDDTLPAEGSNSDEASPMEVQETIQTANYALKVTPSSQDGSKDSTQQDNDEPRDEQNSCSFNLDHADGQHPNGDKLVSEENQNIDTPFTERDNTKDDKIPKEKVDTISSGKDQEDNLSPEKDDSTKDGKIPKEKVETVSSEKDQEEISLPEKDQKDNSPSPKSPNDIQPQDSSSLKDNDQLSSENILQKDDTPPPEETKDGDIPARPKDDENITNTQDIQQSLPMDTTTTDESLKPQGTAEQGNTQLPILQKSVTEPAKRSGTNEDQ